MNEKCLIIPHLSIGDLFIINGIIRYHILIYTNVYFLCKKKNINCMIKIFSDNPNIIPVCIDIEDDIVPYNHSIYKIYKSYKNIDIIKLGLHNNNWQILKSDIIVGDLPYLFFKTFYKQLGLDYEIRYKYEKINRNNNSEITFFNKVMKKYDKYIFLHDNDKNILLYDNDINNLKNKKNIIPIFNPNVNYYNENSEFYNYWANIISDNILDYCKIIENAEEIHVIFSSFFNLCMYLDLSKIKKKYIYTNIINIKDLHKNMKDWIIIYM
jgi:hypothetical protein